MVVEKSVVDVIAFVDGGAVAVDEVAFEVFADVEVVHHASYAAVAEIVVAVDTAVAAVESGDHPSLQVKVVAEARPALQELLD